MSRRRAIKAGTAALAGAAVWAEPTIKGLAKRPAYAAANSSATPTTHDVDGDIAISSFPLVTADGFTLDFDGPIDNDGTDQYTLTASLTGCACSWPANPMIEITDGMESEFGSRDDFFPSEIRFDWMPATAPTTVSVTGTITVTCTLL